MTVIRTGVGRALHAEYEQYGLRVYRDLLGSTSYLGLVAFGLTGRRLSDVEAQLLDDLSVASYVTEPRVFPMKICWIAGSLGRALPAVLCASVAFDSDIVGGRVIEEAANVLLELARTTGGPAATEAAISDFVAARKQLAGFGVPFRATDERVSAFREVMARRAYVPGPYFALAERFWRVARDTRRLEVNLASATAALLLDFGFSPLQIPPMAVALLQPSFLANATEAAAQAPECLRRLPDDCVRYEGPPPRKSPRAIAREAAGAMRAQPAEKA